MVASAVWQIRNHLALFVAGVLISTSISLIQRAHRDENLSTAHEMLLPRIELAVEQQKYEDAVIEHSVIENTTTKEKNESSSSPTITTKSTSTLTPHPLDRIKVPFPIFVASLPKSGTTTTARYFYCGKIWTAHTFCNTVGTTHAPRKQMRVGHCFLNNMQAGRPPLLDCGNYKVWSDAGHPRGTPCFYPSVHGLEAFAQAYPNATILLTTRNSTAWAKSIQRWKGGDLLRKWRRCEKFPNDRSTLEELAAFYDWHVQHLRNFTNQHPSLTYVEVPLEGEEIGQQLETQIGVPAECLGHHNSHEKRLEKNPRFRRQFEEQQQKEKGKGDKPAAAAGAAGITNRD